MSKYRLINFILSVFFSFLFLPGYAQQDKAVLEHLSDTEKEAIRALVLYPDSIRHAIFTISGHPELLVRMSNIQKRTSDEFQTLIGQFPRDDQQHLWNVVRYPGLVDKLTAQGKRSAASIEALVKNFPKDVHESAVKVGERHYKTLVNVQKMYQANQEGFNSLLAEYSPDVQRSARLMVDRPEVLSILNEHMQMTVLVGDMYKKHPDWVNKKMDSLQTEVAQEHAREVQAWKEELENDPEAKEELEKVVKSYAGEENIQPVERTVIEHHYYYRYPYPYWFGYPYWYTYPRWYYYPYWYDCGYYYSTGGSIVFVGLPSYYFTYWYFHRPRYVYYYPYLANRMVNHYYGHRSSISMNAAVRDWSETTHRTYQPGWLKEDKNRVHRIREYGKMEMNYRKEAQQKIVDRRTYSRSNRSEYSHIRPYVKETPQPKMTHRTSRDNLYTAPRRTPAPTPTPTQPPSKRPTETKQQPTPTPTRTLKQPAKYQNVPKANEYHRNTWERSRTISPAPPRSSTPGTNVPKPKPGR